MKNGYDYVVVGGGSAGCVVAARLSEDPAVQVALIEAGPMDDAPEVHTPVAFPQLFKSEHDWDYSSEPEPSLFGRRIPGFHRSAKIACQGKKKRFFWGHDSRRLS